jgi:hypothetical protein
MEIGPGRRRLTPGGTAGEGSGEREDWRRAKAPENGKMAPLWCRGETNCGGGR